MYPELVLSQQHHQDLLDQAANYRLAQQAKPSRPRRRWSALLTAWLRALFTVLLRNPEASAASAAQRENPA